MSCARVFSPWLSLASVTISVFSANASFDVKLGRGSSPSFAYFHLQDPQSSSPEVAPSASSEHQRTRRSVERVEDSSMLKDI